MIKTILLILMVYNVNAYSLGKTSYGDSIRWNEGISIIEVNVDMSTLPSSTNASTYQAIINSAVTEWNNVSQVKVRLIFTNGQDATRSNIYFDPNIAGGQSVLGLTTLAFSPNSGKVIRGDIAINSNMVTFLSGSNYYVGDVLTHELGHFLGLSHSDTHRATMYYMWDHGQSTLSLDDSAGIAKLYQNNIAPYVTGRIIGKNISTGVFGTIVDAVSIKSGRIVASTISDVNGVFNLNVPDNDYIIIHTRPINSLSGLTSTSSYYSTVKNNFCESKQSYVGSFFSPCLKSRWGHPNVISTATFRSKNIGNISIKCGQEADVNYVDSKINNSASPYLIRLNDNKTSEVFVGYFNKTGADVDTTATDYIEVDTSSVTKSFTKLQVRIIASDFFGRFSPDTEVVGGQTLPFIAEDGVVLSNIAQSVSKGGGIVRFSIRPSIQNALFVNYGVNPPKNFYYIFTVALEESSGNPVMVHDSYIEDNSQCVDAPNSSMISPVASIKSSSSANSGDDQKNSPINCASINSDSSTGGGPGAGAFSLIIGFIGVILTLIASKSQVKLKNYLESLS